MKLSFTEGKLHILRRWKAFTQQATTCYRKINYDVSQSWPREEAGCWCCLLHPPSDKPKQQPSTRQTGGEGEREERRRGGKGEEREQGEEKAVERRWRGRGKGQEEEERGGVGGREREEGRCGVEKGEERWRRGGGVEEGEERWYFQFQ